MGTVMIETSEIVQLCYTRKEGQVKGPFPAGLVRRYLLLGRLRAEDEVSVDGSEWFPIRTRPQLIPEELLHLDTPEGRERLARARRREDERMDPDRRANQSPEEAKKYHRRGSDRRGEESEEATYHRGVKRQLMHTLRQRRTNYRTPTLITALLVIAIAVGYLVASPHQSVRDRDCGAAPTAGVNWDDCQLGEMDLRHADLSNASARGTHLPYSQLTFARLTSADFSYAVLTASDLTNADLSNAKLIGANLRGVNLSAANLERTDLSYADLSDATLPDKALDTTRFSKAIWPDGTLCDQDSVGSCLISE